MFGKVNFWSTFSTSISRFYFVNLCTAGSKDPQQQDQGEGSSDEFESDDDNADDSQRKKPTDPAKQMTSGPNDNSEVIISCCFFLRKYQQWCIVHGISLDQNRYLTKVDISETRCYQLPIMILQMPMCHP